jgi:vacuolar-type H+-ATPase subunit I/STV1
MEAIAETGIPAFDQWEDSVKAKRKKHDPSLEGLPETDRYSKIDHQAVLTHLKELSDQAQTILPTQEDVEETGELNHLAQHAAELPYPPMGSTKDVVFVGRMATGKSTVINAVIGKAVCDTAATGSACTQVVTSYAYLEDELEATEDVKSEVLFFTGAELRDLVRKHLHGLQLHHMEENEETEEDPAESDDEEENSNAVKEESPAAQAMTWFKYVAKLAGMKKTFNADSYTNRAAVCYADGERFTSKAILLASKAIADHMTMKGATSETLDTDGTDLDTQKKSIPVLSINVQENHKAIRPYVSGRFKVIVREVRVRLKSDALKTGTVLRDLPGMQVKAGRELDG